MGEVRAVWVTEEKAISDRVGEVRWVTEEKACAASKCNQMRGAASKHRTLSRRFGEKDCDKRPNGPLERA